MLKTHKITADLRVTIDQSLTVVPDAVTKQRIEDIWKKEISNSVSPPFNGPVYSVALHESNLITIWRSEYKHFLAQRRDPKLFGDLRIRPLAITGLIVCNDGFVFGRRSQKVEQDKELWELVPAGGIDGTYLLPDGAIDLRSQFLSELSIETRIDPGPVNNPSPFVLIEDTDSHVFDVGLTARISIGREDIASTLNALTNLEYTELSVVAASELAAFRDAHSMSEVSGRLLRVYLNDADKMQERPDPTGAAETVRGVAATTFEADAQ